MREMMNESPPSDSELKLPKVATIRERLAKNRREASMLRRLLRVATEAERIDPTPNSSSEGGQRR